MDYCIFCDYENNVRKEHIIYEDVDFISFLSKKAMAKGHVLVVPKNHVESVTELYDIKEFFTLIQKLVDAVARAMNADVVNMQITYGETVKKSQPHLYVHVIPVSQRELGYFKDLPELTAEEMGEIAEKIRKELA